MVSVEEAERIVFSNLFKPGIEWIGVEHSIGRVLAEPVRADRPFPPFNRVAMDGIAIAFDSWKHGRRQFKIESVHAAGAPITTLKDPDHCIEVMTGAVLPAGANTIIRYEDLQVRNGIAQVVHEAVAEGQHIHREGADAKLNDTLLVPGVRISAAEVAVIVSVGKSKVGVFTHPRAAIISSGDELVRVDAVPQPHQIRGSNTYAIEGAMASMNWIGKKYHFPDERDLLERAISELTSENDVLVLSGGVSKGKFDFIPEVLETCGFRKLFHQVNQRPGKPFWFGASAEGKIVFALPGNPVSTYMCFYKYIKPWLERSLGIQPQIATAVLSRDFKFGPPLTYFLQVQAGIESGTLLANPVEGGGSGDFANLTEVTGFLQLPPEKAEFKKGDVYPYIPFRPVL